MFIRICPRSADAPATQLATAELHFDGRDGLLSGLKLTGFSLWSSRLKSHPIAVSFPARSYTVRGERHSFALLRTAAGDDSGQQRLIHAIQEAYGQLEAAINRTAMQREDGGTTVTSIDVPVAR